MFEPLANSYPKKCSAIADAIATPLLAFGSIVEVLDSIVDTLVNGPVNDSSIMVDYFGGMVFYFELDTATLLGGRIPKCTRVVRIVPMVEIEVEVLEFI